MKQTLILLFALLWTSTAHAWEPQYGVDLAGGNRIVFGSRDELNGVDRFTTIIGIYRKGSGWFSSSRILLARSATGKRQLDIRAWPHGGPGALRIGIADAPNGTFQYRHVPDSFFPSGRVPYLIVIAFDRGTLRVQVNGVDAPTTGDVLPVKLTTVSGVDLTVGSTDLLQETVFQHAWWVGAALTKVQMLGLWCQNALCDLAAPSVVGPTDALVPIPTPTWYWPIGGTGEDLPTLQPRTSSVVGLVVPGPGTLVTTIPRTPRQPEDAIAFERFVLTTGNEIMTPTRVHTAFPGVALVGSNVLACYSRGNDHSATADQDLMITWSRDSGHTWPFAWNRVWPGYGDVEKPLVDVDLGNARACEISRLKSGRVIVAYNRCPGGGVCSAATGTVQNRFREAMYSDDGGATWLGPVSLPVIGSHYASAGGSGGKMVYRSDGCVSSGVYWRDLGENRYTSNVVTSCDEGLTWAVTGTIAYDPSPSGRQYEEPMLIEAGDGSWLALVRVDDTQDCLAYRSYDEGTTWDFESVALPDAANGCPVVRLSSGVMLTSTRRSVSKVGYIAWSYDDGHTWIEGPDVPLPGTDWQVGSEIVELPNGDAGMIIAAQHTGSWGRTRLEWLRLKPAWLTP